MLPGAGLASSTPLSGRFLSSDARKTTRTVDWERGGVAVNDGSEGMDVQDWKLHLEDNDVTLTSEGGVTSVLFSASNISELALAFDLNMRPSVAYIQAGVLKMRWYDGTLPGYRTDSYGAAQNPKLATDDRRPQRSGQSDIILAYVRDQALYYRQQRDRYEDEYLLKDELASAERLLNIGMSRNLRLQFQLG